MRMSEALAAFRTRQAEEASGNHGFSDTAGRMATTRRHCSATEEGRPKARRAEAPAVRELQASAADQSRVIGDRRNGHALEAR